MVNCYRRPSLTNHFHCSTLVPNGTSPDMHPAELTKRLRGRRCHRNHNVIGGQRKGGVPFPCVLYDTAVNIFYTRR